MAMNFWKTAILVGLVATIAFSIYIAYPQIKAGLYPTHAYADPYQTSDGSASYNHHGHVGWWTLPGVAAGLVISFLRRR
jgi:hypothetical protein